MLLNSPVRKTIMAMLSLVRNTIHVADVQAYLEYGYVLRDEEPIRTELGIPMFRDDEIVGVIILFKVVVEPFTDKQIELVETFADQAVIAIENVRLFTELQEKNKALTTAHAQVTEALDQQTATSEILRVISGAQTDAQPVFEIIGTSALRLCGADYGSVQLYDGVLLHLASAENANPDGTAALRRAFPRRPGEGIGGRVIRTAAVVQIPDIVEDTAYELKNEILAMNLRGLLAVPMLRDSRPIGAIIVGRAKPGPFSENQIGLLRTFADQAVLAIENVRLFNETKEALDRQTAMSEILRVISQSPTDVQPVFDAIAQSAVRLCDAVFGAVFRLDGEVIHMVALTGIAPEKETVIRQMFPISLDAESTAAQAIVKRSVVHVSDTEGPGVPQRARDAGRAIGFRNQLSVPMLRGGEPIGAVNVSRRELGPYSETQIELLKTFADQAVIAIENVRLFKELEARTRELTRSVGELTALGAVSQALSSTLDVDVVLDTIVTRANDLIGADGCTIFEYDEAAQQFHLRATRNLEPRLVELARGTPLRKGDQGILGHLPAARQPVQVPDIPDV